MRSVSLHTKVKFSTYFKISSYAMVASGALALCVSGGMSVMLAAAFASVMIIAWSLEGTRWQLPERIGLVVVLISLPLFYFDWKYQTSTGDAREKVGVSALAHLILFLSAVKLLQVKADRDWVFLYLISFFEVLLAAGLTLSPLFLATLGLYTLCALSTIISFEIRKARRRVKITEARLLVAPDSTFFRRLRKGRGRRLDAEARRLPAVAFVLLVLIFALAMPLFLIAPRYGSSALARTGGGLGGFVGFSDTVNLGDIGRLQQSERVVMRVRVDDPQAERNQSLRWRGVALDEFSGRGWRRSRGRSSYEQTNSERNLFQFGTIDSLHRITTQTFFVEPIDTPVLFAAPRAVALQGMFPYVRRDTEGSLSTRQHDLERITYKAYSDTTEPDAESLRSDLEPYPQQYPRDSRLSFARYLQLPAELDPRISALARQWIVRAGASNRYDAARVVEQHLQSDFGYTLDLKAGGADPLADFLFRVREGHCEYFSTAMAVMLRTQGVAARVVNGFQMGEYNDAADAYTVTQRDAHSWVEVYFPETDSWVTFDPTPAAGRPARTHTGLAGSLGKYAEALELMWIQYVVGYDKQEQRTLATTLRNRLYAYRRALSEAIDNLTAAAVNWWHTITSGTLSANSWLGSASAALLLLPLLLLIFLMTLLVSRARRLGLWRGLRFWRTETEGRSVIDFYERMVAVLAARGLERAADETPLEFAAATGMMEALKVTHAYNRVRFGEQRLSAAEAAEIEEWLTGLELKDGINGK
jgi:transglutaminase-like putative cysteine protease